MPKEIKTKKASKKLTVVKVQNEVNSAIRRRYFNCVTGDESCCGNLEASHFYAKGGSSGLRFYPPNINTQCSKHHFDFHRRDSLTYTKWMQENCEQLEWMTNNRSRPANYNQVVLREIYNFARNDELGKLTGYIRNLLVTGEY
jgi:hypothetical protein